MVSVVLPTHNRASEISTSIQSVLSQSFEDFELLVIDDASTDDTFEIIRAFKDGRIRYLRSDVQVGAAEARNIGIRESRGSLIAFQDSDDEWQCNKLHVCCSALLQDETLDAVFSAYWRINGRLRQIVPPTPPPCSSALIHKALLTRNFAGTPTAVVRAEALKKIGGFDSAMPRYQDWDLFLRLSAIGRLGYIDQPLVLSYVTANSISADIVAHKDALIIIYEKNIKEISSNKALNAYWLSLIGRAKLAIGDAPGGRRNLMQAARLEPLKLIYAARIMLCIPGAFALYIKLTQLFPRR